MLSLFQRNPEKRLLRRLNADFNTLCDFLPENIALMTEQDKFSAVGSISFETPIPAQTWQKIIAQDFSKLEQDYPDKYRSIMAAQFELANDHDLSDIPPESLIAAENALIGLDLESTTPHIVRYFQGFSALPGYRKLQQACGSLGLDFSVVYDPQGRETASLGIVLESVDKRPLLSCLRDPKPSAQVYEHP